MSETQSLSDLARFAGQSALTTEPPQDRQRRITALAAGFRNRPQYRGVADLLGVVLTLSARTRRLALPKADVDIDVFTPDGSRAVRLYLPR